MHNEVQNVRYILQRSASSVGRKTTGGDDKTKDLNSAQGKIRDVASDTQITGPTENIQETTAIDEAGILSTAALNYGYAK